MPTKITSGNKGKEARKNIKAVKNEVTRSASDEMAQIRNDLDSLSDSVIELTRSLKKTGNNKVHHLKDAARDKIQDIQSTGAHELHEVEDYIKSKPRQSLTLAFIAGMVASQILRHR